MADRPFADHFSGHAATYARYRPGYPAALFDWLAAESAGLRLAWDCATGNGQAALALTGHFERVIATDASAEQIAAAPGHPRIDYRVAAAEDNGIPDAEVDAVCVAQAAHWLEPSAFYREVERVLKPGGLLAMWGYGLCSIGPDLDPALRHLYANRLRGYWPPQRRHIDREYRLLPFPYPEIRTPAFELRAQWSSSDFLGYLSSWSAVQKYRSSRGEDPLSGLAGRCRRAWPEGERREVIWPLFVRAGRRPDPAND